MDDKRSIKGEIIGDINDLRNIKRDQTSNVRAILFPKIATNAELKITNTML